MRVDRLHPTIRVFLALSFILKLLFMAFVSKRHTRTD